MGSLVILGILVLIVGAIIVSLVKKHKKGQSSCGCGCSGCNGCRK